jgi:hypothetical protein
MGLALPLLLSTTSCGDGLQEVELGDLVCEGRCSIDFEGVDLTRDNNFARVRFRSTGRAAARILDVRLENTSPFMRFNPTTAGGTFASAGWEADAERRGFPVRPAPFEFVPNSTLTLELQFGPTERGDRDPRCPGLLPDCGTLVVETNIPGSEIFRIPISLPVNVGSLATSRDIVDFPAPSAGQTYRECFNLSNSGSGNVTLSDIRINPDLGAAFSVESADGLPVPITLPPGRTSEFCANWRPTTTEELNADVTFVNNGTTGPVVVRFRSGRGTTPTLRVEPCDNLVFADPQVGEPNEILIELTNTSTRSPVQIGSMLLRNFNPGDAQGDFALRTASGDNALGAQQPIEAGQARTYRLVYTPSADRPVAGSLRISGNFEGTTRECRFSAGPASPFIEVLPTSLFWSGVAPGNSDERSFTIFNTGRAALTVSDISLTESGDIFEDEFQLGASANTPITIQAGGSHRVVVTFQRAAEDVTANDNGIVTVTHNDTTQGPLTINLQAVHDDLRVPPACVITATPGEPYAPGDTVTLDAGTSVPPPGGTIEAYSWALTGPEGSTARLTSSFAATTALTFDLPGLYEVVLTAEGTVNGGRVTCQQLFNLRVLAP